MIQTLLHTTENNNLYIYDDQRRLSMLVHPEIRKAYENSTDVNPYYLKKYEYLKDHSFFTEAKIANFEPVNESMIKENIIQTKQIVFEVTDSCNLSCTYCGYGEFYDVYDERNHNNINIRYAIKFLRYIFDLKLKSNKNKLMIGFYGGEPLLNINFIKQIIEVVNQLNAEKKMDIEYSMTTNATLIHKHINFLVANKFEILISLDGNEENHSYRVFSKNNKNSFRKVIENIDMIQKDYPVYFANYISFNAVLHNRNSVKEIYEFIYTRYNKISVISELLSSNIKPKKKEFFEKMYHSMRESEAEYQKEESSMIPATHYRSLMYDELDGFLKQLSINYYISNITSLFCSEEKYFPTDTCLPFSLKMFLTTHNRLLPCERINHKYSLGKVTENVLIDVHEITRQYNCYYNHLKKVCQYCYAYKYCGLCMFRIKNLEKLDTEKFVCDRFYDQMAFKNKLNRIFSFLEKYPKDFFHILEN
nr:radical SAM peptide maturase [uncultured Macellibacteroides sp.]